MFNFVVLNQNPKNHEMSIEKLILSKILVIYGHSLSADRQASDLFINIKKINR